MYLNTSNQVAKFTVPLHFAIKPSSVDQKLEKSATFVVKVKKKFNYGIYDMEIVRGADGHQFNGDIVWRNEC
ncbi:hypothetical protein DX883_01465 [Vibrio fluvialis]|nr:hypothetical protein [Vibrio fluvialis]